MVTISNSDIAIKYKVSKAAVTYWIRDAREKKNNLILELINNKFKVTDNAHNHSELLRLSEEGRKFRRNTTHAEVTPTAQFYKIFSDNEVVEIIRDLEVFREINYKYTYKGDGAKHWDSFYHTNTANDTYHTPEQTRNLLKNTLDIILQRIPEGLKINVIDLGPGNSLPIKEFLQSLYSKNILNKYIGVDISPEILEISENNFKSWLPNTPFTKYVYDFERASLLDIFQKEKSLNKNTVNVVLNTGGTIDNHNDRTQVLKNICNGLGKDDVFILANTTDLDNNRSVFSYFKSDESLDQSSWIPRSIGFGIDDCEFTYKYDEKLNCKVEIFTLDKDYSITFNEFGYDKVVNLQKGEEITVWRHYMTSLNNLFDELDGCGLRLVAFNTENDFSHILMICELNK